MSNNWSNLYQCDDWPALDLAWAKTHVLAGRVDNKEIVSKTMHFGELNSSVIRLPIFRETRGF